MLYSYCSPGTYIITAPNRIRPSFSYSASINVLGNEPLNVEMIIQDDQNKTIVQSSQSNMKPGANITLIPCYIV